MEGTQTLELCEIVDKQKLLELINSGLLGEVWTDEDKKKKHKWFNTKNYTGELEAFQSYYNSLDGNGMVKITYKKDKKYGRYKLYNCLSSMRRIYRNRVIEDLVYDFDMVNSCATILLYLVLKHLNHCYNNPKSLKLYVNNRQKWFNKIKKEFNCDDKKAKELMTSLTFGANLTFKDGELNNYKTSLLSIQTELKKTNEFDYIETDKKGLSWLAKLVQTIECEIVVGLMNYIIQNYPELTYNKYSSTPNAIYELDGFKLLKENVDNFGGPDRVIEIINEWLRQNSYNTISFINKSMEEKIDLSNSIKKNSYDDDDEIIFELEETQQLQQTQLSDSPMSITNNFSPIIITSTTTEPEIKITLEDLDKGERYIADLIYPLFTKTIKYYEKTINKKTIKLWYELNDRNLWIVSTDPPKKKIITKLHELIEIEKLKIWNLWKIETDTKQKEILRIQENAMRKHYSSVGKSNYSSTLCKDYLAYNLQDNSFPDKLNKTKGKMIFNDGIYNLKTRQFKSGFNYEDYLTTDVLLDFNYLSLRPSNDKIDYLKNEFKKIYNNDDLHLEYALSTFGYALTGDASLEKSIWYIIDGTEEQKGDNGKTFIFNLLSNIFKGLVKISDSKFIEDGYTKVHKHLMEFKNARIIYLDEGTTKKINASIIKKIGDGINIEVEIMFGTTEDVEVNYKLFVCSNHIPKIGKNEEAVFNRYIQIQCNSHFDRTGDRKEENPERLEFIADTHLPTKLLTEYRDELIMLFLDYACKYYERGLPKLPTQFTEAKNKTKIQNNEFAKWFFKNYEASSKVNDKGELTDKISLYEIANCCLLDISEDELKKELRKLKITYDKDLRGLGTKIGENNKKVYIKGGFIGWIKKQEDKEEEADDEKEERKGKE